MTTADLLISMSLKAWNVQTGRAAKVWSGMDDQQMLRQVAPGRNRIIYLLGHLTAANDGLFPLFSEQPRLYPELETLFLKTPDDPGKTILPAAELRAAWGAVSDGLSTLFAGFSTADWLDRHNSMTAADLSSDPGRNRMSVLMSRTTHMAYHIGQIVLAG